MDVDLGDEVRAGKRSARILVPDLNAELRSAQMAKKKAEANLHLATVTWQRLESLREKNPESVAQQDVDIAKAQEMVQATQVDIAKAELDKLRTLTAFSRVLSPFDGRVTRRLAHPGDLVRAGTHANAQPLVEMARTDKLRVVFDIPESIATHVHQGMRIGVRFNALPNVQAELAIERLARALDRTTRNMRAEADLDNQEHRYQPGMYASVYLEIRLGTGSLMVASQAVRAPVGNGTTW